jgi:hypothetical protein
VGTVKVADEKRQLQLPHHDSIYSSTDGNEYFLDRMAALVTSRHSIGQKAAGGKSCHVTSTCRIDRLSFSDPKSPNC